MRADYDDDDDQFIHNLIFHLSIYIIPHHLMNSVLLTHTYTLRLKLSFRFIHFLVVPEIDKSPTMVRAASEKNEKGRLVCRVQAAPKPSFTWARASKILNNTHNGGKYLIESRQIDPLTYESVLMVDKVESSDYDSYECRAENELGASKATIRLEVTSKPDAPLSLNILNTTHGSVSLAWTPGFDGGLKTTYQLRYREANGASYRYVDSLPNVYKVDIEGLKSNTLYLFSIMAMNNLGNSGWLPDTTRAQTKGTFFNRLIDNRINFIDDGRTEIIIR
jgi:hypothetical protein